MILPLCARRAVVGLVLSSGVALLAAPPPSTAVTGDPVTVKLNPLGLADNDLLVGGAAGRTVAVPLNLPLLRRVVLTPDDVQAATIAFTCKRAVPQLVPLARGTAHNGETVLFGTNQTLQAIPLKAGQELAFIVWKSDWHYNGGGTLQGLKIVQVDQTGGRREAALPAAFENGSATTPLGTFSLAGLFNRDRFPELGQRVATKPGAKPGDYTIAEGHGVSLGLANGGLHLHTNGRATFAADYGWAPALVFKAAADGVYAVVGTLAIVCAKPDQNVSWLVADLTGGGDSVKGTTLSLHRLLREPGSQPVAGQDYAAEPIARFAITNPKTETVVVTNGMAAALRQWLSGAWADHGLLLVADRDGGAGAPADVEVAKKIDGTVTIVNHPKTLLFDHPIKPRPGVYATMKEGRLYYGDQRLRLWGLVKDGTGTRIRNLGFNCLRTWFQGDFYDDASAKKGLPMTFTPGDGSKLDRFDYLMNDLKTNGIFVMMATLIGQGMPMPPLLEDDSWIACGDDWKTWKAAVTEAKGATYQLAYVDDRLWKIRLRHATNVLNHRNPYTGKRYAEEEIIALIEINNEAGMLQNWLEKGFASWPVYFRNELQHRWNVWLAKKYAGDAALRQVWTKLDDDETLGKGTIKLEPDVAARTKYPANRAADFVRFLTELIDAHNQEYRTLCRAQAPAGVGVNVAPFSFDSQYRPSIPWLYTNWKGDADTVSMYFWSNASMLTAPPSLYVLDSHRLTDRLGVIYETQRGRPSPYRTEYPYMLATMVDWQDFDIVVWHGAWFGGQADEQLLAGTVAPPNTTHFWNAVHLEAEPVMTASIAMAGRLFLNGYIGVAPKPAVFTVGKQALFSYDTWNGLGGRLMSLATFQRGSRIALQPDQDGGVLLDGQPRPEATPAPAGAFTTGEHVLWDWPNGRLIIDSPCAKVYAGRTVPSYRFKDGITLSGFNTPFVAFSLISADGKPLLGDDPCRKAYVSAVFDAKNTGFDFDYSVAGGPVEQAKAVRNAGRAPVVVDPVSYSLSFPQTFDGRFIGYDFALRQVGEMPLHAENTLRQHEQTLWMGLLNFASRGAQAEPVTDASPGAALAAAATNGTAGAERSDPRLAAIPNPLPGLSWGDNYHRAHRNLRDSAFLRTRISPEEMANKPEMTIAVSDAEILMKMPANVDVSFAQDRMSRIAVNFTQAPAFTELVASLKKTFGAPAREHLVNVASEQSEVAWTVRKPEGTLSVVATEVQGVVRVAYALER